MVHALQAITRRAQWLRGARACTGGYAWVLRRCRVQYLGRCCIPEGRAFTHAGAQPIPGLQALTLQAHSRHAGGWPQGAPRAAQACRSRRARAAAVGERDRRGACDSRRGRDHRLQVRHAKWACMGGRVHAANPVPPWQQACDRSTTADFQHDGSVHRVHGTGWTLFVRFARAKHRHRTPNCAL